MMLARRKQRGHTLMEVMLAVMMLAVCAVIFSATLPVAHQSRAKADDYNVATSLAQKMMEKIRTAGYVNTGPNELLALNLIDSVTPVATNTYSFSNIDNGAVDSPGSKLPSGTGRILIETIDTELKRITLTIAWNDRGRSRSVAIAALIANV